MPRPKSLTLDEIATAALAVSDRDGLSALSMRTVAAELGVGTMSIYRYVADREELERLMVDLVLRNVKLSTPSRAPWRKKVALLAQQIREAVAVHPSIVPLLMAHRHSSRGLMRCAEALLQALTEGEFTGKRRVIALRTIVSYINGALQAQHVGPLAGPGTDVLAALPATEYPLLAETARYARTVTAEEEFGRGLEAVLRGLKVDSPS
jgi:AcrR family transcriptional regulator